MSSGNWSGRLRRLARELTRRHRPDGDDDERGVRAPDESPELWARVKELFDAALETPTAARDAFIQMVDKDDPTVAAQVRALVESHEAQGPLDGLQDRVMGPLADRIRSSADLLGETVLQYQILEKLEGGGMGVVYRALDTRLNRPVALKFLSTHLLANRSAKERFLVEARAAATLDHPNLCTIHEVGETEDGHLFIAMAFYDGQTLKRRIARGPVSVSEALDITAQIARGLACAAEHGVVHRDIKPGNVILTPDGSVKIVDFGVAKVVGGELTQTGALLGTVSYMSPEQTRGEVVDQRTDVWSVGVVLYEMLSGKRPFLGGADLAVIHAILNEVPPPLHEIVPGIGLGVSKLVERTLRKDPAQRYSDAASLLRDVERLVADPGVQHSSEILPAVPTGGERRVITVLSCAISGYEGLLDTLAPEYADQALSHLRGRLQGLVEDYGGVLNDFSEAHAVALFGVPLTHEDDALRAVRAGLEVQRELTNGALDNGLVLGAAVGAGHVAIRATDTPARPFRIGGTVVRDVSLLAATAGAGEVLIAPHLSRSLAHLLVTEERPPVVLASGQPPVRPLAVLGESESDSVMDASTQGSLSRFMGRQSEMDTLSNALNNAAAGRGGLISIVGEAGLGKSRLLYEFRRLLAEEGIRYVQGRCHSYGSLTPYVPLVESVKSLLGVGRSAPEQTHDLIVQRIRALAPELEIFLPILLHTLSIDSVAYPLPDYLSEDEFRGASAEALVSVFTFGAKAQPLVMLLEDWHWSDSGSRSILEALAEMASTHALLIIVTSRPRTGYEPAAGSGWIRLDLPPLDRTAARRLVRSALRSARVPDALADEVCEKAGGNPFFIEEMCHALLESRTVVIEDGEARVSGSLQELDVPDTVQAVLRSRLDRLDPEAREVLRCASVIGRQFGLGLLGRIVPSPSRLDGALSTLRALGFIQRTSMLPDLTHRFNHALTLEVTYDSLLERQRKERHGAVGAAIEELYADHLDDYLDRLAGHFAVAEEWDKAIQYGLAAADRSAGLWQHNEAVATLDRTRAWIESLDSPAAERRGTLVSLLLDQERHLERLGDRNRQQSVIDDLLALVPKGPSPERAAVLVRQGECFTLTERYEEAEAAFDEAVKTAEACGADQERSQALRGLGLRYWRIGQYQDAVEPLTRLVGYSREAGPPTVLFRDLLNLGRVYRELQQWDEAWALLRETEALEQTASPLDLGCVDNFRGHLLRSLGRPEEALRAFQRADEVHCSSRAGRLAPIRVSIHLLSTAAVHLEMGLIDEALALYEESTALARRANRADHLAHTLSLHGDALVTLGAPDQAVPMFEEAAQILRRLEARGALSQIMEKHAAALEAAGMSAALDEEAEDLLSQALSLATELSDAATIARIRNRLALRAWRREEMAIASDHFEQAAECLKESGVEEGLGIILNGWGAVLSNMGRHEVARGILQQALEANRRADDVNREADTWSALGASYRATDDAHEAYEAYEHCLERRRSAADRAGEAWALARLAALANDVGSRDAARVMACDASSIAKELGDVELMAICEPLAKATDQRSSA